MKTDEIKFVTPAQIKAIHAILNNLNLLDMKAQYVFDVTGGRTQSTRELTFEEAKELIRYFNCDYSMNIAYESRRRVYISIYKIARVMDIIYGDTQDDHEMNKAKLDKFCRERGTIKKNLNEMNLFELKKTHRQFEAMLQKFNVKKQHLV